MEAVRRRVERLFGPGKGPREDSRLYAYVQHFLDPDYPEIRFVFRSPFPIPAPDPEVAHGWALNDKPVDDPARASFVCTPVHQRAAGNGAAWKRVADLVGEEPGGRTVFAFQAKLDARQTTEWVIKLATGNDLLGAPASSRGEGVFRTFERCLEEFNRWLRNYQVATESSQVRRIRPEMLDELVVVLVQRELSEAPEIGGFLMMPAARRPRSHSPVTPDEWPRRLANLSAFDSHLIDDVVVWRLRGEYQSDFVGDYAMAIVSLQTAAERLVSAVWRCIRVDRGWLASRKHASDKVFSGEDPAFRNMIENIDVDLGDPWTVGASGGPLGQYWNDLYMVRNAVGHRGYEPTAADCDRAMEGMSALNEWVKSATIAYRHKYPRTATLVHSWIGLAKHGALDDQMRAFMGELAKGGEAHNFWYPEDQRGPHAGSSQMP